MEKRARDVLRLRLDKEGSKPFPESSESAILYGFVHAKKH